MESNSEIDSIINELKESAVPHNSIVSTSVEPPVNVSDENVNSYVYQKTTEIVQAGLNAITALSNNIMMGADPKEVSALASLIGATTKAIDSLNSINLQQKQATTAVELKKMDIAGKKDIVSKLPAANNILIATRDEVINKFVDGRARKNQLDVLDD
jgi:hypothetical protein